MHVPNVFLFFLLPFEVKTKSISQNKPSRMKIDNRNAGQAFIQRKPHRDIEENENNANLCSNLEYIYVSL
jgi:hypothetical protein